MSYDPINISLPGSGMIATLSKRYETLTDEWIQQWLHDLIREYRVEPDYFLVSQHVRNELFSLVMRGDNPSYNWQYLSTPDDNGDRVERYPNKITGKPIAIVAFPGLPAKTLFVASMLKIADERVQTNGFGQEVTRTYTRQQS